MPGRHINQRVGNQHFYQQNQYNPRRESDFHNIQKNQKPVFGNGKTTPTPLFSRSEQFNKNKALITPHLKINDSKFGNNFIPVLPASLTSPNLL
mmetsp:Transcript_8465/g.7512  ORF Transcript_8465/g.7512 Transcript_8465/m.7512 type:complete len:94 (+) Transcript_8465:460-741(+)